MKYIFIVATLWLIYKYRWDIFGLYVDWVEPKDLGDMPTAYVGIDENHDYESIRRLIHEAAAPADLKTCWTLIEMFQDAYAGFTALSKVNTMINLYQNKEAEIQSRNTISVEVASDLG